MPTTRRRYPKEELARRGTEIYDRDIRSLVEADHTGEIVVIDVESGVWEMDVDEVSAAKRLARRCPEAQSWMVRVGYPFVRRFGGGRTTRGA
jgi:hypothetical protein